MLRVPVGKDILAQAFDWKLQFDMTSVEGNQEAALPSEDPGRRSCVAFKWCYLVKVDQNFHLD